MATLLSVWAMPAALAARQQASGQRPSAQPMAPRQSQPAPLGFSVVLVVGDLQAGGGEDDVPPAARRALSDMKDFLPYKSYKLVDAAWIIGTNRAASRLKGPDDREYELEIVSSGALRSNQLTQAGANENRISVGFSLRDAGSARSEDGGEGAASEAEGAQLRAQLGALRDRLRDVRTRNTPDHPSVRAIEEQIRELEGRMSAVRTTSEQRRVQSNARAAGRSVINTSFAMDIGETVVVGTSRMSGNSKALIALLTAVPQKGTKR
jgi:hypothetical protein